MYTFTKQDVENAVGILKGKAQIYEALIGSKSPSGTMLKDFKNRATKVLGEDFDSYYRNKKFFTTKECPVCSNIFTRPNSELTHTCSYACSNTHFRSGKDNPNYKKGNNYRTICFLHHKKECIICKENLIVEVHHYNENHEDNRPENLVPLCSTHHKHYHSKYKHLVSDKIDNYVKYYIENRS